MVGVAAVAIGAVLALSRMRVDVFPNLNQPVIYVCQPYGGMTPQQMEGLLTTYYEYHFLYVSGIHHIESKNIQGMALLKCYFHPGTDMAQATSEVVAGVNRSRFMMPPGTVPPFVSRLDVGSASIGFLIISSDHLPIKEVQDIGMLRIRPMFAGIPGVSTPPAFGGNQRAVVVSVDPDRLRSQGVTLDQVTVAVADGNSVTPSGNVRIGDRTWIVTTNSTVGANPRQELGQIPVKMGDHPIFLRDVATIEDSTDITAGYVLVDGKRSIYMLVTKRAEASTLQVVRDLKAAIPKMQEMAPDLTIEFAFDPEGLIGALLTGLTVLLFLRDWRSVIVVVLNIPLALLAAVVGLWLSGQTINLMTLGGLALAVGILVDEATVEVENIHSQMERSESVARAVRRGNAETAVPRLLAMLCILAVFVPSFFMQGAARELFVPLALAVGFSMIGSYILSSTFVPVLSVWLLRHHKSSKTATAPQSRLPAVYRKFVERSVSARKVVVPIYFAVCGILLAFAIPQLGTAVFPPTDEGQFQVRLRAPTGTRVERTEELTNELLRLIQEKAGPGNVNRSVGYVGTIPSSYPIQAVYQWTSGPEEVLLKVGLRRGSGIRVADFQSQLRDELTPQLKEWLRSRWAAEGLPPDTAKLRAEGLRISFEPGDLISEVMSFGALSPVEVQISGSKMADNLAFAEKVRQELATIPELRDIQIVQAQDYPTLDVQIDRMKSATMGLSARTVAESMVSATASSRFMNPIYWRDPASGQGYIVQVQVPPPQISSIAEIGQVPVRGPSGGMAASYESQNYASQSAGGSVLLRDVAQLRQTNSPAQVDRYNMRRMVSLTASVASTDLGRVSRKVEAAIRAVGTPPKGVAVDIRGQVQSLEEIFQNLALGLLVAVLAVFLLLTAYFQSVRLSLIALAAVPATLAGVILLLILTGTTLNLQSFMGAIMAIGVAVANAILLITFAERSRLQIGDANRSALDAAQSRFRPILMTSLAMGAGMVPLALGINEGGDQVVPLGRAVIGGLLGSTATTLLILPAIFSLAQSRASTQSASLDPDDSNSQHYSREEVAE